LKLQKLLYYAQGFHLALFNKPLFDDKIEAWKHGPVVRSVYRVYSQNKASFIKKTKIDQEMYSRSTQLFLNEIWRVYGQFSGWKLRELTHNEPPWKNAFAKGQNTVISHESLRKFFETRVA